MSNKTKNKPIEKLPEGSTVAVQQKEVKEERAGLFVEHRETGHKLWFDPTTLTFIEDRVLPFVFKTEAIRNNNTAVNVYNYYNLYLEGYKEPNIFFNSRKKAKELNLETGRVEEIKKETTE